MENVIRKGVSILFIYIILALFTVYMTRRIERLDLYGGFDHKTSISLIHSDR